MSSMATVSAKGVAPQDRFDCIPFEMAFSYSTCRTVFSPVSAFQPVTSSSGSQSSMSVDEEPVYKGPILAKARVKMDYTPSPYDKEALSLKVGIRYRTRPSPNKPMGL